MRELTSDFGAQLSMDAGTFPIRQLPIGTSPGRISSGTHRFRVKSEDSKRRSISVTNIYTQISVRASQGSSPITSASR